jgi:short-subunit dehydrogenase
MLARESGTIINVASTAGFQPLHYMAIYAATKAFVVSFSQALSTELAGTGVGVTAVCPGPVPTEFQSVAGIEKVRVPVAGVVDAATVAKQAIGGARRNKPLVINGRMNSVLIEVARLAPRGLVRRLAGAIYRPQN